LEVNHVHRDSMAWIRRNDLRAPGCAGRGSVFARWSVDDAESSGPENDKCEGTDRGHREIFDAESERFVSNDDKLEGGLDEVGEFDHPEGKLWRREKGRRNHDVDSSRDHNNRFEYDNVGHEHG
jgi:hypothetical protein